MCETDKVIKVKILPRSSRNQVVDITEGVFKVKLTAPPVEGQANKALKKFFSSILKVPKTDIEIVAGTKSRNKSLVIHGVSSHHIKALLYKAIKQ
ncbi:MAG: YggU family protein [Deltaproteobacteria bacterium]|nr:YggU family protein [Deltaproteobacteria bacterium]